jgi:chromosome segregation ATPase
MDDERSTDSENNSVDSKKQFKQVTADDVKPNERQKDGSLSQTEFESHPGKIFEESTKSISAMADSMSETARLVSSMKEGLERVNKIADVMYNNPLTDTFDNHDEAKFSPTSDQNYNEINQKTSVATEAEDTQLVEYDKIDDPVIEHAKDNLVDLKSDTESIRQELLQFQDNIKQKESELIEFREKLNQARQHAKEFRNQNITDNINVNGLEQINEDVSDGSQRQTEFDAATLSDHDSTDFNSVHDESQISNLTNIQQQIREGEKKLFELRWKIKKIEAEYEKRKVENDELGDLATQIQALEAKRDLLKTEIKELENQNKESKHELKELEQKIVQARKEADERLATKQELEDVRSVLEYFKLDKESLKSDLEEFRIKIKNAEKEFEEKKAAAEALEDVRLSVTTLKAEKDTIFAELEQLQIKLKKAETEYEEKQAEKEELGEFKAILTHMKIEKESLEADLTDLKAKIKKAETEYEEKKAAAEELHEVREILAYLKPERDSVKSELNQLRSKIDKLQDSYDEINSRKRELHLEYDDLKLRIGKLESEYEEKKKSLHFR